MTGDRRQRRRDLAVLAGLGAALAAGLLIEPALEEGEVALQLFGWRLPATCWFRLVAGLPCAGCGMTRAVVLALHGQLRAAAQAHPFALPLLGLAAVLAALCAAGLAGWSGPRRKAADRAFAAALAAFLAALLGWWALGLARAA